MFKFLFGNDCMVCRYEGNSSSRVCDDCMKKMEGYLVKKWVGGVYVLFKYEGMVRSLVLNGKYRFNKKVWEVWKRYLEGLNFGKGNVIIYIPTTFKRYCFRGFNQSFLLAKQLEECGYGKVHKILKRNKFEKSTSLLGKYDRKSKIKGNFEILDGYENFLDRDILIVDDVLTTGATIDEVAKVLVEAGFESKKIRKIALASGRLKAG